MTTVREMLAVTGIFLLCGWTTATATVTTAAKCVPPQPVPKGFENDFRVFIGTGVIKPNEKADPPFVDCDGNGICDGSLFQTEVMGRSEKEIAEIEQLAKQFFNKRFGIDVDSPSNAGSIRFTRFTADPRVNSRNYVAAGKAVPPEGWFFYEGGWQVSVTDPDGIELGGEWAGNRTGAGSIFLFGNYLIMETDDSGQVVEQVPIYFRSGSPMDFDVNGREASIRHELSLEGQDFPTGVQGQAAGFIGVYPAFEIGPNALKFNVRAVLTFGPSSVFPGLGPDGISGDIPTDQ